MNDTSRAQGGLICIAVFLVGLSLFIGMLKGSYLALAIPVGALVFFVLGLAFWVGWTIMTIDVEPEPDIDEPTPSDPSAEKSA